MSSSNLANLSKFENKHLQKIIMDYIFKPLVFTSELLECTEEILNDSKNWWCYDISAIRSETYSVWFRKFDKVLCQPTIRYYNNKYWILLVK